MAGNKKPKKAYKPRPIYRPQLLNSFLFFNPFIRALDALVERQEMRVDAHGNYVIDGGSGKLLSFTEAIDVFVRYVEVLFVKIKREPPQLVQFKVMAEIAREHLPFDYDNIMHVRRLLDLYLPILGTVPPLMSQQILTSVRTQLEMERLEPVQLQRVSEAVIPEQLAKAKATYADIVEADMIARCRATGTEGSPNAMVLERVVPEDAPDGALLGGVFEMTSRSPGAQKKKD